MKTKKVWIAVAVACAVIVAGVWLVRRNAQRLSVTTGTDEISSSGTTSEQPNGEVDRTDGSSAGNTTAEPSPSSSPASSSTFIPGYRPALTRAAAEASGGTTVNGATATTTSGEAGGASGEPALSDGALRLESVGAYAGDFVEDGTNDAVGDTAALLVTNTSGRMLQMAEITFQVNATEQARFVLTNIPAGARVLALEQNRRSYSAADDYSFGRTAAAYTDAGMPEGDAFVLDTATTGQLAVENHSGADYERLYVYYKYVQADGVYLGGITFRVPFDNLANGARAQSAAGHFDPAASRVVAITTE